MLRGWKTWLGVAGMVLTSVGGVVTGELEIVPALLGVLAAVGIGGSRAKMERMLPTDQERN